MHNIEAYLVFCRFFGIVSSPVKSLKRFGWLHTCVSAVPAYVVLFTFIFCVCAIFWHINADNTDLTLAANWIQFLPNTFGFIYLLVSGAQTKHLLMIILTNMREAGEKSTIMHQKEATKYMKRDNKLMVFFVCGKFAKWLHFIGFLTKVPSPLQK